MELATWSDRAVEGFYKTDYRGRQFDLRLFFEPTFWVDVASNIEDSEKAGYEEP